MKNDKKHIELLKETRSFLNKVRNINEAMTFDEDYDDVAYEDSYEDEIEMENNEEYCPEGECDIDAATEIDKIREIALKGMLKNVKNSKSPEYETLKKIFQFCDKINNDKTEDIEK